MRQLTVWAKCLHISAKPDGTYSNQQTVEGFAVGKDFGPILAVLAEEEGIDAV